MRKKLRFKLMQRLLLLLLIAPLVACQPAAPPDSPASTPVEEKATKQLTMADYEAIPDEATLAEARTLLGSDGKEMSSSEVAGIKTAIYIWENTPPTSNITLTFQNGKMVSKAQFGLK
jgi:hypothetical protein